MLQLLIKELRVSSGSRDRDTYPITTIQMSTDEDKKKKRTINISVGTKRKKYLIN